MPIFGQGLELRQFALNYGLTECDAFCGVGLNDFNVFAFSDTVANIGRLYADTSATVLAPAGWYSDGSTTIEIDSRGINVAGGTGAGCVCTSSLTAFSVVASEDSCSGCCSSTYSSTVYGNGATLFQSTEVWANSTGTVPLPANYFYKNASGQVQVGRNGNTVVDYIGCTGPGGVDRDAGCGCNTLVYNGVYAYATSYGGYYATPAEPCNNTGPEGYRTFWQDQPTFAASTVFYFDASANEPIGFVGLTGYVSDGYNVSYFAGAYATGAGLCSSYVEIDRNVSVAISLSSTLPGALTINADYYTSPDPETRFLLLSNTYSGTSWSASETINYNSLDFVAFGLTPSVDCAVQWNFFQNGILVESQYVEMAAGIQTIIRTEQAIGNNTIQFSMTFYPIGIIP